MGKSVLINPAGFAIKAIVLNPISRVGLSGILMPAKHTQILRTRPNLLTR